MHLHGSDQKVQELFPALLSFAILYSRVTVITQPTDEMLTLLRQVTPLCKASLKGAGTGSNECIFMPGKLVRKATLNLDGEDPLPLIRSILLPAIFSGRQFTLELEELKEQKTSLHYVRDVLFAYLKPYLLFGKLQSFLDGKAMLQVKGSRSLEEAPPFFLREQPDLIAIRGVAENYSDTALQQLRLGLKDCKVPITLDQRHTGNELLLHMHALFGTNEGYDNDFPSIIYYDKRDEPVVDKILETFLQDVKEHNVSTQLIQDLLPLVELVGGTVGERNQKIKEMQEFLALQHESLTN